MAVLIVPASWVFKMHDTHGLSFEIQFSDMAARHVMCDPVELLNICDRHGWNRRRTAERIEAAWRRAYPTTEEALRKWCEEWEGGDDNA